MRGGLLWGIYVLTVLFYSSSNGRRIIRSGYYFANRGPLNQVAFLRNIVPEAAKFKRNAEITQDVNQQTLTYTNVEDDRSAAVAIANAGDTNNVAPNIYSPMSYFNKGNAIAQATANAQATGNSQAAANTQASANAQASGNNAGTEYNPYGGYGGYRGYGGNGQYGLQSLYNYPTSSSLTSAQAQALALSNKGNSRPIMSPSLLNTPSSSSASALAQATANVNPIERNLYGYPYLRTGEVEDEDNISQEARSGNAQASRDAQALSNTWNYPDPNSSSSASTQTSAYTNSEESNLNEYFKSGEDVNVSETERAAHAQAIAIAQALSNSGSNNPWQRPSNFNYPSLSSSSVNAQANANSQAQERYNIPYFRSGQEEGEENILEAERSAYSKANAKAQALSNGGLNRPKIRPSLNNMPSYSSSSAHAKALAKARLRGNKHHNYLYRKSGDDEIDQLSAEGSAQDKTSHIHATGSSRSTEELEESSLKNNPSSRLSAAVTQAYLHDKLIDNPNSKSDEVESFPELEHGRSAYSQAVANSHTGNVGNSGFGIRPSFYNQPSSSISSALAQALANSYTRGSPYGSLYSRSGEPDEKQKPKQQRSVDAQEEEVDEKREAEKKSSTLESVEESESKTDPINSKSGDVETSVDSKSNADENSNTLTDIETLERNVGKQEADDGDKLDSEENRSGLFAYGPSTPGFVSRVLSNNELIDPNAKSGQNLVQCTRPGEIHAVWLLTDSCLICTCVQELWGLRPVCASCNTCLAPPPPPPPPLPPIPDIIIPQPLPVPQVSCDPLPTETPFENPLNPCQICICKRSFDVFGQPDVEIQCEENVQCMLPDIIPMPIPEPPNPSPSTVCDNFPLDVSFPNPFDECQICSCVLEPYRLTANLICVRNPECDIIPGPLPPLPPIPPMPLPPLPLPIPDPEPFPIISPDIVDIEPIPWPPIVPRPKPKSPLPGPPPHDTCQPYPPNTPFQHPWDECQICECSEIYGSNIINIEVNCYTKPSCCNDLIPEPLPLPGPTPDQICQFQSLNVDFPSPTDACKTCNCQLFGTMILPVCRPSTDFGCNVLPGPLPYGNVVYIEPKCQYREPYQTFIVECNLCYCQEVFQYVIAKCTRQPNCVLGTPGVSPLQIGSDAFAQASANANANLQFPNLISPLDSYNNIGNQLSSAIAEAQAQSSANSYLSGLSGLPLVSNGNLNTITNALANAEAISNAQSGGLYNSYPYGVGGGIQSAAQAEAIAAAQSLALAQAEGSSNVFGGSLYGNYPITSGVSGLSNAQAQAEAIANTQALGISPYGTNPYSVGGNSASAQAQADAISNAQGGGLYNTNPYLSGSSALTNAQAQAEAIANTQALGISPYGTNPYSVGGNSASAQAQADAISNAQGGGLYNTNPYLSGSSALTNAQAQAEAIANAQSLGALPYGSYPYGTGDSASASALAQAQANSLYGSQSPLNSYPYSLLGGSQSNAQAQADATAGLQAGLSPYLNYQYPGSSQSSAQAEANAIAAASQMYPNLYPLSSPNLNPLYGLSQGQSYAEALANAQAQGSGSASAQSLAQTAAQSGRPLIRSGRGLCKYDGDKYHHNCQACFCFREITGDLYTLCLGNPCQ